MGKNGGKSISYFGLVAMGIGCMLGTSWLLLTGTWLETAGGPLNLVVAFVLCILIELPFAFAYMEAIPMLPLPGGEVVYSYAAFGSRGGFAVGWAGILMNTIVFCWVDLAAVSLLDELFPVLGRTAVLYQVGDFPVTLPNLAVQLALAGAILWIQLKGANVCASLAKIATVVLLVMCAIGLAVCFTHFDPAVYASDGGPGLRLLRLHGPAESAGVLGGRVGDRVQGRRRRHRPAARKAGAALITCLLLVTGILCLVSTAVAGCMPWREAVNRTAPFADVLVELTGVPAVRVLFLVTAFVGAGGGDELHTLLLRPDALRPVPVRPGVGEVLRPPPQIRHTRPVHLVHRRLCGAHPLHRQAALPPPHQHRLPGHRGHVGHVPAGGAGPPKKPSGLAPAGVHARRPDHRGVRHPRVGVPGGTCWLPSRPAPSAPWSTAWPPPWRCWGMVLYHFRDRTLSDAQRAQRILGGREKTP